MFYSSNIDSETAEILKRGDFEFWTLAPHFSMIWNETVTYKFWRTYLSRMPNMQVSLLCKEKHMKAMLHWQMCGCIFKIWAQWIDYKTIIIDKAFISYIIYMLVCFKSKCGCQ